MTSENQHNKKEKPPFELTDKGVIALRRVRLRFFSLYAPGEFSGKETYNVTCEISKEQFDFLNEQMMNAAKEEWGASKAAKLWGSMNKGASEYVPQNGGESYLQVRASNNAVGRNGEKRPGPRLYTRYRTESKIGGADEFYAGCLVNLFLTPWAYSNASTGVKFNILAVQFADDGPKISGATVDEDDLDDLSAELTEDSEDDVPW